MANQNIVVILGDQSDSDDSVIGRKKKKAVDEEDDGLSDLEPSGEKVEGNYYQATS